MLLEKFEKYLFKILSCSLLDLKRIKIIVLVFVILSFYSGELKVSFLY